MSSTASAEPRPGRPRADIVIGGSGIAGIAAAEALSRRLPGADVLLVDRLPPMSLTSATSGELYRDWWLDETMGRWIHGSIERMEGAAAACGNAFAMNRRGYAFVYTTREGEARARAAVERFGSFGLGPVRVHDSGASGDYPVSAPEGIQGQPDGVDLLLDAALIRRRFPWVTTEARAVIHARRAGWLDAHGFGMHLLETARARGVRLLRAEITGFRVDGCGVRGVDVVGKEGPQTVETRSFVDAAGPFFGELARGVGLELPVMTVLHQLVLMPDPAGVVPRDAPYTIFAEPQRISWSEEERDGLIEEGLGALLEPLPGTLHLRPGPSGSPWIRLGWPYHKAPEPPTASPGLPPEFPEVVLRGARRLCPGLARYGDRLPRGLSQSGGYYCRTAENLPLVGPSDVPGFWLLGALSGYGLMAACGAGDLLADWIEGSPPLEAGYLSLARYENPASAVAPDGPAAQGEL